MTDRTPCAHCWHSTGNMLTSNPPQYELLCCHCGETIHELRLRFDQLKKDERVGEHGKFVRQLTVLDESISTSDTPEPTTPQPDQPAEPPAPPRDINAEAANAIAALGAVPIVLIVPLNGNAIDAQSNIALPTGWRLAVGYVERQK